mmetsp:Transcript_15355/g.33180  ORF Transcript_15355/g.33180 Transcript_15355/m.33180 type:complete len:82 (-) Transcript_15355:1564-1809(-)
MRFQTIAGFNPLGFLLVFFRILCCLFNHGLHFLFRESSIFGSDCDALLALGGKVLSSHFQHSIGIHFECNPYFDLSTRSWR